MRIKRIKTDDRYWDCECEYYYIHDKKDTLECPICGSRAEDMPDSRVADLGMAKNLAKNRPKKSKKELRN